MNKNEEWNDIRQIADKIGDTLDVDRVWEDFNKRKKRRRRVPIWWWGGGLTMLLISTWLYIENTTTHTEGAVELEMHDPSIDQSNIKDPIVDPVPSNQEATATETVSSLSQVSTSLTSSHHLDNVVLKTDEASHDSEARQFGGDFIVNTLRSERGGEADIALEIGTVQNVEAIGELVEPSDDATVMDSRGGGILEKRNEATSDEYLDSKSGSSANYKNEKWSRPITIAALKIDIQSQHSRDFSMYMPEVQVGRMEEDQRTWTFGLNYELAFPSRNIVAFDEAFADRRQSGEKLPYGHFLSTKIRKKLAQNVMIGSGLEVGLYQSRLREQIQEVLFDIEFPDRVVEILTQNGQSTEVIGTAVGSQTIIRESVRYQRYIDIRLPLYVGGILQLGSTSKIELTTGVSIGILQSQSGSTYESYFSNGTYQPLQNLGYKSFGQLQGILNLNYVIGLAPGWDVAFGLAGRYDLNSRTKEGSDQFKSAGISIGLKKRIGGF